jgi:hypothetical protein
MLELRDNALDFLCRPNKELVIEMPMSWLIN